MSVFEWVLTFFIIGGVIYNFYESAAERGFDLFEVIGKMFMGILFLFMLPFMALIKRWKNRKQKI